MTRPKLPVPNDSASRLPAAVGQGHINLPSSTQGNNNIQAHEFRTNTSLPPDSSYVTRQEFLNSQNQLSRLSQSNRTSSFDSNLPSMRNRRSTDGRPICNRCNQVGHVASRCFVNLNRQTFTPRSQSFNYVPRQNFQNVRQNFQNNTKFLK